MDIYSKNVLSGTIKITPPSAAASATGQSATFVNNAVLNESSLGDSAFGNLKDNPFYQIFMILYDLLMDMLVVVIFWLIFISIGCWLKVDGELLYPSDPGVYPYRFFTKDTPNLVYNYLKHNSVESKPCMEFSKTEISNFKEKQNTFFEELEKYKEKPGYETLRLLYPKLFEMDADGINPTSEILQGLCPKDFSIMDCVTYTLNMVRFHSYVSCNSVLSSLHGVFAVLSNDVLGRIVPYKMWGMSAISIVFAAFLYFLLLHSGTYTDQIIEMSGMTFSDSTDPQTIMINQFKHLIVNVLTCCMLIFVPLFILLFMAFPSLYLLYLIEEVSKPSLSVKVVGHQ
jgi:hypothetical protein